MFGLVYSRAGFMHIPIVHLRFVLAE